MKPNSPNSSCFQRFNDKKHQSEEHWHKSQFSNSDIISKKCLSQIQADPLQDLSQQYYPNDPIKNLFILKQSIGKKMEQLDTLNVQFYEKQQKLFLKTFINMMDRMSDELMEAKLKYDNIDQQIDAQQECVDLRKKLKFFKDQSLFLSNQVKNLQDELSILKNNNQEKENHISSLKFELFKYTKKQKKYTQRRHSLETKMDQRSISKKSFTQNNHQRNNSIDCNANKFHSYKLQYGDRQNNNLSSVRNRPKTSLLQRYKQNQKFELNDAFMPSLNTIQNNRVIDQDVEKIQTTMQTFNNTEIKNKKIKLDQKTSKLNKNQQGGLHMNFNINMNLNVNINPIISSRFKNRNPRQKITNI